ncbi:MAG: B12-binding domain-containing radical SAM protein [Myxococcales bacterium]|nr:B12-binding domain-containing radical SAM protein [Myxococcales bacterium]
MMAIAMEVAFGTLRAREVTSFGIMYVAAALREAGHRVRLVQATDAEDLVRQLRGTGVEVLGLSVTTGLHKEYLRWARAAKRALGVRTVMGGPHPTFFPEILANPALDAVVVGEGEGTAPELLEAFRAGDGRVVRGARYRHGDDVVAGPLRPMEQELDRLPLPDRDLFFADNAYLRDFPVKAFLASRGCPFRCAYCFNGTLLEMYRGLGKSVRLRSPALVVDEVLAVRRRYPMSLVWFLDANFCVSRPWVEELGGRLRRDVGLPFYCKVRPDQVDARLARALAAGGCSGVGMGIETGDDELRIHVLDRKVTSERIVAACRLLREHGIRIMSFNMVALPGETYALAKKTMELNVRAGVDYAMTMVFQPYPGTRLTDYAVRGGWFHGDFDALDNNYYAESGLREPAPGERARLENLQRLLALAVEFPEVRARLDWLVERPWQRLYGELFQLWHRHCFHARFYGLRRPPLPELAPRRWLERLRGRATVDAR